MNYKVLSNERTGNQVSLKLEISVEDVESAINSVYKKEKSKLNVEGFRKGKAPRKFIEKIYGKDVFYNEAVELLLGGVYPLAVTDEKLRPVDSPAIDDFHFESGEPMTVEMTITVEPEVTLGVYKGIVMTKPDTTVTPVEMAQADGMIKEKNAVWVPADREAKKGDRAIIDFCGYLDETAFEGGEGKDYPLELGSHSFIDGFEEQIEGHKAGEEFDIMTTFPQEYHDASLAGKETRFHIVLSKVEEKKLPQDSDAFAEMFFSDKKNLKKDLEDEYFGAKTMDKYKEYLGKALAAQKEKDAESALRTAAVNKIMETSTMDIPEAMINGEIDRIIGEFSARLQYQGMNLETYFRYNDTSMEKMREELKEEAVYNIKQSLVLNKIAEVENLEVTSEDIDKELDEMGAKYGMNREMISKLMNAENMKAIAEDMVKIKALDFVMAEAKMD